MKVVACTGTLILGPLAGIGFVWATLSLTLRSGRSDAAPCSVMAGARAGETRDPSLTLFEAVALSLVIVIYESVCQPQGVRLAELRFKSTRSTSSRALPNGQRLISWPRHFGCQHPRQVF